MLNRAGFNAQPAASAPGEGHLTSRQGLVAIREILEDQHAWNCFGRGGVSGEASPDGSEQARPHAPDERPRGCRLARARATRAGDARSALEPHGPDAHERVSGPGWN